MEEKSFDKNKKAVALSYKFGNKSPQVVAKGRGFVAGKILENAEEAEVPVYEDKQLVSALMDVELGANIPPELYEVVAQVLVFVSDIDKIEELKRHAKK